MFAVIQGSFTVFVIVQLSPYCDMWWCSLHLSGWCSESFCVLSEPVFLAIAPNWWAKGSDSQQGLISLCRQRIMSRKDAEKCQVPHTADSDELARGPACTAVNHKLGQVSPAGSGTNLRALHGTKPKLILFQCFHHGLFIKLSRLWTWGGDMQLHGIAPNQQIIRKALWNILFESVTDCTLWDMSAKYKTVVDTAGLSFFAEWREIFIKVVN